MYRTSAFRLLKTNLAAVGQLENLDLKIKKYHNRKIARLYVLGCLDVFLFVRSLFEIGALQHSVPMVDFVLP